MIKPIDYRAHFAKWGMNSGSLFDACLMARERVNRRVGQRVRRELERMRDTRAMQSVDFHKGQD